MGMPISHGNGTTCEICTPRPSSPSSLASALEPTKLTFQNCGNELAFFMALINAPQLLYALIMTTAAGLVVLNFFTAAATSTVLRSTVAVSAISKLRFFIARSIPASPALP